MPDHCLQRGIASADSPMRRDGVSNTSPLRQPVCARHLRAAGWRVEAAANGALTDDVLRGGVRQRPRAPAVSIDPRHSRDASQATGPSQPFLETQPDIVHAHTPIASFVARLAVHRLPVSRRPAFILYSPRLPLPSWGHWATNQLFLAVERLAGRWTDLADRHQRRGFRGRKAVPTCSPEPPCPHAGDRAGHERLFARECRSRPSSRGPFCAWGTSGRVYVCGPRRAQSKQSARPMPSRPLPRCATERRGSVLLGEGDAKPQLERLVREARPR